MEVWNVSSKAIASYSTLPQNRFNQEWLDINRSDSHIRVLIEPWRNGVSIPFTWLGRDWTVPMLNHAPVHHLHIIFFTSIWLPWFQVWPVNSLAGDFWQRPTLIQIPTPECECTSCCPYLISSYPWMTSASFNSFRIRPTALVPSWYWNLPHRWRH